jgi:FAD/FMN-containing dehydrogenase
MIGGNIATNAGGLQALRYGVTRQLVLGLEVVLADGTVLSSMNKMLKNNAGYDLKQLFIGSEGTLGVITRAVLKLEAAPQSRQTALVAVAEFGQAVQLLNSAKRVLGNTLTTYELIWQDYYRLMTTPPSVFAPPLAQHYPFYLLIETLGQDPQTDAQVFQDFLEQAIHQGLVADAALVQSQREFDWFWGIREKVEHVFSVHNPVFLFDVSVAISDMGAYIDTIVKDLRAVWPAVHFYAFGHMADGNLHLYVSCGQADASTRHRVEQLVFEPLRQIGGSITAEHGVGLEKKEWLHFSRTPAEINLMKALKQTLDPRGILNPGKIWS